MSVMRHLRFLAAAMVLAAVNLAAAGPVRAGGQPLTVVELFTSQGCPLCPPADEFLGELRQRGDVLALGFHVDYWDYIGWPDPFARPDFTRRQQNYLGKLGFPYVFTPQAIVDGVYPGPGNKRAEVLANIARAAADDVERIDITLTQLSGNQLRIEIPAAAARYRNEVEIILLRLDSRRVTDVPRGENAGKTLVNYNVVRLMRPLTTWQGDALDQVVRLTAMPEGTGDYCAVLAQEYGMGRILGAATLDMRAAGGS